MNTSPQLNPKEEKANLEKQYYALMKHASRNSVDMQHFPKSILSAGNIFFACKENKPKRGKNVKEAI